MSSTKDDFLLEPTNTAKQIRQKIGKSFCEPGNLEKNVALNLAQTIVFPLLIIQGKIISRKSRTVCVNLSNYK